MIKGKEHVSKTGGVSSPFQGQPERIFLVPHPWHSTGMCKGIPLEPVGTIFLFTQHYTAVGRCTLSFQYLLFGAHHVPHCWHHGLGKRLTQHIPCQSRFNGTNLSCWREHFRPAVLDVTHTDMKYRAQFVKCQKHED